MSQQPPRINEPHDYSLGDSSSAKSWALGILGAAIGGGVGWFLFGLLYNEGFYALALPGALVGLGFGKLSRRPMIAGGVFCAVLALVLMLMCEWHFRPWLDDESLGYFFSHLHDLTTATLLFLLLGVVLAFGFGRSG